MEIRSIKDPQQAHRTSCSNSEKSATKRLPEVFMAAVSPLESINLRKPVLTRTGFCTLLLSNPSPCLKRFKFYGTLTRSHAICSWEGIKRIVRVNNQGEQSGGIFILTNSQ